MTIKWSGNHWSQSGVFCPNPYVRLKPWVTRYSAFKLLHPSPLTCLFDSVHSRPETQNHCSRIFLTTPRNIQCMSSVITSCPRSNFGMHERRGTPFTPLNWKHKPQYSIVLCHSWCSLTATIKIFLRYMYLLSFFRTSLKFVSERSNFWAASWRRELIIQISATDPKSPAMVMRNLPWHIDKVSASLQVKQQEFSPAFSAAIEWHKGWKCHGCVAKDIGCFLP